MASMRGIPELLRNQHWSHQEIRNLLFLLQIFSWNTSCVGGYLVQFVDLELEHFIVAIICRLDQTRSDDVAFITSERVIDNEYFESSKGITGVYGFQVGSSPCVRRLGRSDARLAPLCRESYIPCIWGCSYTRKRYADLWGSFERMKHS